MSISFPHLHINHFTADAFDDVGVAYVRDPEYAKRILHFIEKYPDPTIFYGPVALMKRMFSQGFDPALFRDVVFPPNLTVSENMQKIMGCYQDTASDGIKIGFFLGKVLGLPFKNLIYNKELFADLLELAVLSKDRYEMLLACLGEQNDETGTLVRFIYYPDSGGADKICMAPHFDLTKVTLSKFQKQAVEVYIDHQWTRLPTPGSDEFILLEGFLRSKSSSHREKGVPHRVKGVEGSRIAFTAYDFPFNAKVPLYIRKARKKLNELGLDSSMSPAKR